MIVTGKRIGSDVNICIAITSLIAIVLYLDISVSKKKMMKYRYVYGDHKKYVLYYFLLLAVGIALAVLYTWLFRHINGNL